MHHCIVLSALFAERNSYNVRVCVCVQKAPKGQSRVERLRKKMNEQESWLLLHSPTIPFCIHNKHGKVPCPFLCHRLVMLKPRH